MTDRRFTWNLLAFVVVILPATLLTTVGIAKTDQEIKPTQRFTGKIQDPSLRTYQPANGIVKTDAHWRKLWGAWRPNEALKKIDFSTQFVLVETASGPNNVFSNRIILDDKGALSYETASTLADGPGFGYLILVLPKAGIVTVNGKPVHKPQPVPAVESEADPNSVGDESVTVEIVGRVRTGVVSIGGETTGTLIAANGIVWELDLQGNKQMRESVRGMGNKPVRVKGSLKKRSGVEIRERWIVTVDSLSKIGSTPLNAKMRDVPNDTPKQASLDPQPVPPPPQDISETEPTTTAPARTSFKVISISASDAGNKLVATQAIEADGTVKLYGDAENLMNTWTMRPAALSELHELVATTDWANVPRATRSKEQSGNAYSFTIAIETPKGVTRIFIDQPSIATQPTVDQLFTIIKRPTEE